MVQRVALVILAVLLFPDRAEAYVDPGAGHFLVQIAMSSFAGMLFLVRDWFKKKSKKAVPTEKTQMESHPAPKTSGPLIPGPEKPDISVTIDAA